MSPPCSGVSASHGHRSLSPRVAHAPLRTPVSVCPHAPRLRPPRLTSCRVALPPALTPLSPRLLTSCRVALPPALTPLPLSSCRMGWRPRSRGACGQMLSPVRSGASPTATCQRGGGARRVDRGRGERLRSAELRSLRDQPPAPAQATHRHIAPSTPRPSPPCADARRGHEPSGTRRAVPCPRRAPGSPPRSVTARYRLASPALRSEPRLPSARPLRGSALPAPAPLLPCSVAASASLPLSPPAGWVAVCYLPPRSLSPPAGWVGALGAAERAGRCYPRFGAARRPPARVSGAGERAA